MGLFGGYERQVLAAGGAGDNRNSSAAAWRRVGIGASPAYPSHGADLAENTSTDGDGSGEEESSPSASSASTAPPPVDVHGPREAGRTCDRTVSSLHETVTDASLSPQRHGQRFVERELPGGARAQDETAILSRGEKLQPYNRSSSITDGRRGASGTASKSSWISGSVSLDSDAKVDDELAKKLGLGIMSAPVDPNSAKLELAEKEEKEYDPFDLGSATTTGSGPIKPPRWLQDQNQGANGQSDHGGSSSSSSSSSSSESSSSGSYTSGSSSESSLPAEFVIAEPGWDKGSVADSSIKSLTVQLRSKVQEEAIREASAGAAAAKKIEKLPVYTRAVARKDERSSDKQRRMQSIPSIREDPSLDPLYVGWSDNAESSSREGEDNFQAWPDSPLKLRKHQPKPQPDDIDPIQKGWVIICVENIISPEKADEQETRAKILSSPEQGGSSSGESSPSSSASASAGTSASAAESDLVRKELTKREQANPNIVHEEQRAVGNLSAMWEAKASKRPDDPTTDTAVVQSRKQAQERIGAFRRRRAGATTLQTAWRRYCARKKWLEMVRSAITIQNAVRTRRALKTQHSRDTRATEMAACQIQAAWRSHAIQLQQRRRLLSSVLIQSKIRRSLERKRYLRYRTLVRGVIILQSCVRGMRDRLSLEMMENAARCIQRRYRSYKIQEVKKAESVSAAKTIQTAWRRYSARGGYHQTKAACIVIQSAVRRHSCRQTYRLHMILVRGVTLLQALARATEERRVFCQQVVAARYLQSWWRRYVIAAEEENEQSATVIASWWRMHSAQTGFAKSREASIALQSAARGSAQRRRYQTILQKRVAAAILIQRAVQSHRARRAVENMDAAAIAIQSSFRSTSAARCFARQRAASISIQAAARGSIQRTQFENYRTMVLSFVAFQAIYRGMHQRKQMSKQAKCATTIANKWRSHRARANFLRLVRATILLQAVGRGGGTRQAKGRDTFAARTIQCVWRRHCADRDVKLQRDNAATKLQSVFRAALAWNIFQQTKASALCIQRQTRCWLERERFARYICLVRGCITLQALMRGVATRRALAAQDNSARFIQNWWHARNTHWRNEEKKRDSAAIILQSSYRRLTTLRSFRRQQRSVILMQSICRMSAEKTRLRKYIALVRGVVILQSIARRLVVNRNYEEKKVAATVLQAWFRSCRERDRFLRYTSLVRCCIAFQALVRGSQARGTMAKEKRAACAIQQMWKKNRRVITMAKGGLFDRLDEANDIPLNEGAEMPTQFNSSAISVHSSSSLSQNLRNDSCVAKNPGDDNCTGDSRKEGGSSGSEYGSASTRNSSDASYDEDGVRQALALGAAVCGVACFSSLQSDSYYQQDLLASDESDEPLPRSSGTGDDSCDDSDLEIGNVQRELDTSSVGSSHLSDYFDDDLPPASRKISPGQAAGVSSEASPKREASKVAENLSINTHGSNSSSVSSSVDPARCIATVLAPVVEASFEVDSEEGSIDLEANIDRSLALPLHTTPNVDERRMDCVAPSSYEQVKSSSIRARAEALARQNTLGSASSLMGSSSNLSSCFREEERLSPAGQSTLQHEDKHAATKICNTMVGHRMKSQNAAYDHSERCRQHGGASEENEDKRMNVRETRNLDPVSNELSYMEEGFGNERISLVGNDAAAQKKASREQLAPQSRPTKQSRKSTRPRPRPPAVAALPLHSEDARNRSCPPDNKVVPHRGHRSWCCVFSVVGTLALIAGVVVSFTVDFSSNNATNAAGLDSGTNDAPSFAPTSRKENQGSNNLRPSPVPTPSPSLRQPRPTWVDPTDDTVYKSFVSVLSKVSAADDIVNTASPQYKAISWIAKEKYVEPTGPFTVQRYILALLYFSTNGDSWTKCGAMSPTCSDNRAPFLSKGDECSWHGVYCNDKGFIIGLELDRVGMDGTLPMEVGNLSSLERLVLPRNRLASTLPSSLGQLKYLLELNLFDNDLSGSVPAELRQLPLQILQISTNKFTGPLTPIFNPGLHILDVSANDFGSTLPAALYDATSLKELNLSMNRFSGTLSSDLDKLTELRKLIIALNAFSGKVPGSIGDLKTLETFHATYNSLTGSMPSSVCDLFEYRLKRLSTDCLPSESGRPAKIVCSCCTLCLEGNE